MGAGHAVPETDKSEWQNFLRGELIWDLKQERYKNIVIMTGAGISVAAGIPDFRSPGSGLSDNIKEFNLATPESIFDIDVFRESPEAFYRIARDYLDTAKFRPTYVHHFCKMLHDKGMVRYYLTQNIDNLEAAAGFRADELIQAHGANFGAVCSVCGEQADRQELERCIQKGEIMCCEGGSTAGYCDGPIKPEIVFFGENLPEKFYDVFDRLPSEEIDLLIVIGTSLAVGPFN